MSKKVTVFSTMAAALMMSAAFTPVNASSASDAKAGDQSQMQSPDQADPHAIMRHDPSAAGGQTESRDFAELSDMIRHDYTRASTYAYEQKEAFLNWSEQRYENLKDWVNDAENWTGRQVSNSKQAAKDGLEATEQALEDAGEATEEAWEDTKDAVLDALAELEKMRDGTEPRGTRS